MTTPITPIKATDWPQYIKERNAAKSPMLVFAEATAEPVRLKASFLEVYANGTFYVVGEPGEGHECGSMLCNDTEHNIAKGRLADWQVEQALGLPSGFLSGNYEPEAVILELEKEQLEKDIIWNMVHEGSKGVSLTPVGTHETNPFTEQPQPKQIVRK